MPSKIRIEKRDDVEKIPDLITAIMFMKEHELEIPKNVTKDMAKKIIIDFIIQNGPNVVKQNRLKDQNAVEEALDEDKVNRAALTKLYEKSELFFHNLPKRFRDDLNRVFPDFLTTLKEKAAQLKKSDCAIFVAGDTGSGKSTLINLLVGMQILPTHALECTATLCELRRSPTRSIILHYRDRKQSKKLECTDSGKLQDFQKKLVEYVTEINGDDESPYEKVEINWPFPMMQEGVVFVDTPGIGGSFSLDMGKYLDKALGFIYVINTGDAGGIHRDRLGGLLRQAMSHEDFDPATAVFVCNKWDQVGAQEKTRVQDFIRERLRSCIPTVSRKQIYEITATDALRGLDYQLMTEDHKKLVEGIRRVLPITLHSNLKSYYRWLGTVLKRTVYSLKVSKQLDARTVQEKEQLYKDVCSQIEQLETRAESRVRDMRKDVKAAVEQIATMSMTMLSKQKRERLYLWSSDLCPRPDGWKKVVTAASGAISSRIQDVLDTWDRDNEVVATVNQNIIKKFRKDVDLFQDQAKQIEGAFMGEDVRSIVDLHNSMRVRAPVRAVWTRARGGGERDEGFMSLGSAVGGAYLLDPRKSNVKGLFKQYDFSKAPQIMQQSTMLFVQELTEKKVTAAVEKFFERYAKNIDRIGKMLPEFLRADRQLMKSLVTDVKSKNEELVNTFPKLIEESMELQGYLDMFFAKKLMKFDYLFEDLNLSHTDIPIGRGSFANVYFSKLTTSHGDVPIALKVCKEPLDVTNVTDVLLEDNILRDLDHKNVVKYYGASRQIQGRDIRWVMVLEYCPRTLQQKFVGKQVASPARHDDIYALKLDAMKTVAYFAEQICCGLEYLHSKKLVHRDMKPDNILLDEKDVVKLTDVGLAKRVQEISGTIAGSPVYMAPEVLLQKGQYGVKADMYSMGIILWEMWYGMDAADHIKTQLFTTFERAVEKGLRPSMSLSGKPPEDWRRLIVRCWDMKPEERPTSSEARRFFQGFLQHSE